MEDSKGKTAKVAKKSWFRGLRTEFKRITWPDRPTVAKRTLVVIIISVILGAIITIVDTFIQYGLDFIFYYFYNGA